MLHGRGGPKEVWIRANSSLGEVMDSGDLQCLLGFILKLPIWGQAADENCFDDSVYWEVSSGVSVPPPA